jgi:amino acid adenylation domain-containing protein
MAQAESLVELLRRRGAERPDDHAFTFLRDGEGDEARWTYRQLDEQARVVAGTLQDAGAAGERALLLYPPGPDYLAAFLGCLYAGTVAVPIYPPRQSRGLARLLSILGDAGARFALGTRALLDGAVGAGPGPAADSLELSAVRRIATDELAADAADAWRDPGVGPSALAFLQYTSGSTAEPKGVMLSHGNLLHNLELIRQGFGVDGSDVGVIWLPPYHDMGLIGGLLEPIYAGFPAVLLSPMSFLQKPLRWLAAVSRFRGTVSGGPNFAYDLAVRKVGEAEKSALDLSSWSLAFNGAEPIRSATLERFARAFAPCGFRPGAFYPCYGLAEATLFVTGAGRGSGAAVGAFSARELARHRAVRGGAAGDRRELVASGRCPEGQRVEVVDPETGAPCAPGWVGEVWIAGPSVARGYWRRRELTAAAFGAQLAGSLAGTADETAFLRTGDLGFLEGGLLYVTGRSKDLMILRGRNVYPQDVEVTVEAAHPALRAGGCAAFSVDPDDVEAPIAARADGERREECLVVVQELRRDALRDALSGTAEAVAAAARRAVAEEHEARLHALVLIRPSTLPKTSSGKVRRRATREAYLAGSLDEVWRWTAGEAPAAPVSTEPDRVPAPAPDPADEAAVEAWLAAEVARHAGVAPGSVDPHAPAADHGLDSLGAMEVAHAVEARFGVVVPMERLLEGVTMAELAAELAATEPVRPPPATGAPTGAEASGDHPLSRNQLSLWFLHALDPESPAYNVPAALRVRGELDRDLLVRALEMLVARHPALRTTFAVVRGEPRQRVAAEPSVELWEEDARGWSHGELEERLRAEARRPFDLEDGPLFRAGLLQLSRLEHVLLLSMHHVVTDFWSLGVLLDELGAVYPALAAGQEPHLPPAPEPYASFVRWQEELLAGPRGQQLEQYWCGRLGGRLPVLELHTDRPRPRVQSHHGGAVPLLLPPHRTAELRALARRCRATPFMLLAAAFEALLSRYTGQDDLLLGTVAAGRSRAELARTVGYFVNPVVLRADLSGDPSFEELLERTRRDALGAFEHQDYPFPLLVERLQPERDPGRSPIFQAVLVFQRAVLSDGQDLTAFALAGALANGGSEHSAEPRPQIRIGGLHLESQPLDLGIAQFDLTLTVGEVAGAFTGTLDYNRDLFDGATARRIVGHLANLAAGVSADPARALSELPILSEAERRQLVVSWNDTRTPYRREATLAALVEEQVERTPDHPAVLASGRGLTYRELDLLANRLARHLRRRGVGPERVVGVLLERSPELMVAILGVLKAGGAYLPLDPDYPRERLVRTLDDADVRVLVTEERFAGLFRPAPGQVIVRLDADRELVESESADRLDPCLAAGAHHLACVIYTSGSTGEPKGVLLEHRSLVNLVGSFLRSYEPGREDRILPLTSLAHASFVGEIFPLLAAGGTLVLPSREELLETVALLELVARHHVSILSTVPSLLATLNAVRDELPSLRLILVGGEALSAGDVDRLIGAVRVVNGYGLTEAGVCTSVHPVTAEELQTGSKPRIGKPVMNTRIYVLDRGLRLQPVGCPGELYVAGDGLARAYRRRPGLTAERFVPDPFTSDGRLYRTGDLGVWEPDGTLQYLGRIDHQVKVRGFRIEPGEIESVLAIHPKVQEAAVAVSGEGGEARLVGYVVGAGEPAPTPGELLAHLRERLPDYMVPADFVFLPALPLSPSGKVDLAALPAPPAERTGTAAYRPPKSELERRITAVWSRALGASSVGLDDNFFDLGGHSLLMTRVHAELAEELAPELVRSGRKLSLIELFKFPTVGSLAAHLAGGAEDGGPPARRPAPRAVRAGAPSGEVAIVGVAGRFPGAEDPDGLWRNLVAGAEAITFFSDEELLAAGADPELLANPDYVKAKGILGDVDLFDAELFGLNPREVELMDPQHRLFLECCWEALERAGYDPERYAGSIGVFGGESMNTYLLTNLLSHLELVASVDTLQAALGNDKDPLTSRVAYKLSLKGPSITIQSASSTSLVAVHVACQSILHGHCDMALAGGVSIHLPEVSGYMYQDGGTTSRDGHCRAFDASSTGFVSGHGAGVVVLKLLEAALADGDHVHAVIKSAACNNDGALKVSFMAPSVDGQVDVYTRAYDEAGVSPDTLGYVECHGTGTALGDPIEIAALTQAFSRYTDRRGFCAIGSLKTNLGHLDAAAGVCGLIKATLALEHAAIPPSLHFERPNPRIDFGASPFFVNTELAPWERANGVPRRAAVTSLGMGGTNAHVILEEAPERSASGPSRPWQLLLVSGKTEAAADAAVARLAARLSERPETPLADVAYTLHLGRKPFPHRRMLLCRHPGEAAAALAGRDPERLLRGYHRGDRPVALLFPGQGAQYPDMGRGLYEAEASFREDVDRCAELLVPHLDLREVLFPGAGEAAGTAAAERLRSTELAQPALFAVSWATARLWMRWGVRPDALLGHSLGEYVAACVAGVLTLEDALTVVAARGHLMQQMPAGAMLAVPLPEAETRALVAEAAHPGGGLDLAAINRPGVTVVSGSEEAVAELAARLEARGAPARRLHTSHAFHSWMMDPIVPAFVEAVKGVRLEPPRIPYLSNLTGTWIRPEEATDPAYWGRQLRGAVRYAAGVATLLAEPERVLLEVGPGNTLATLSRQHPDRSPSHAILSSLRHPKETRDDLECMLDAAGRLWLAGGEIDWAAFWQGEERRRVPLPTYPFERQRYWVDPLPDAARKRRRAQGRSADPGDWLYAPVWRRVPRPAPATLVAASGEPGSALLLADPGALADACARALEEQGHRVTIAEAGEGFERLAHGRFRVRPGHGEDLDRLLEALGAPPRLVLHLWAATGDRPVSHDELLVRSLHSLVQLAPRWAARLSEAGACAAGPAVLAVVSDGVHEVTGREALEPLKATLLGACGTIPREYPEIACRHLDLEAAPADGAGDELARSLLAAFAVQGPEPTDVLAASAALRGRHLWTRGFERIRVEPVAPGSLPASFEGACLVTGGLGGIGLELAAALAREAEERGAGCRLVSIGRSPFPEADERDAWLAAHGPDDRTSRRIVRVREIEALGAEVLVWAADVASADALRWVEAASIARFGPEDGRIRAIVHAAGVPGGALLRGRTEEAAEAVLAAKVRGTLALEEVFGARPLDFFVLCSSLTGTLPEMGQADYAAANAFLDAFATARNARGGHGGPTVALGWDVWREVGMAVETEVPAELAEWRQKTLERGIASAAGAEVFRRALGAGLPQVVVSTVEWAERLAEHRTAASPDALEAEARPAEAHPRPELANAYVAPESETERAVAAVWQEVLGIDRVGLHDNFFDLGGNSLAGLRITRGLRERLAVALSDVSLYEAPTVAALARLFERNGDGAADGHERSGAGGATVGPGAVAASRRERGERRKARLLARLEAPERPAGGLELASVDAVAEE